MSLFSRPEACFKYNRDTKGVKSDGEVNRLPAIIGRHWETGSVCNYFAYRGVKAPHTGQPYSEALLLGVSGGSSWGIFFAYKGYDRMSQS
jgi:hypothetical protein